MLGDPSSHMKAFGLLLGKGAHVPAGLLALACMATSDALLCIAGAEGEALGLIIPTGSDVAAVRSVLAPPPAPPLTLQSALNPALGICVAGMAWGEVSRSSHAHSLGRAGRRSGRQICGGDVVRSDDAGWP